MRIILASQSSVRKHALDVLGLTYEIIPSDFDESTIRHNDPNMLAQMLSEAKSRVVGENCSDALVIAADCFVVYDNKIYEKPVDLTEAKEMLLTLSGNTFRIIAGLAVYNSTSKKMLSTSEVCEVKFRDLSEYEVDDYVTRYPVLNCAAAFEADGLLRFAERVKGNYNFKTAMPVDKLVHFLRENGVNV